MHTEYQYGSEIKILKLHLHYTIHLRSGRKYGGEDRRRRRRRDEGDEYEEGEEDPEGYLYMDEDGYYYDEEGNCYYYEDEDEGIISSSFSRIGNFE